MSLNINTLTDNLSVAGQIDKDDIDAIKAAGFRSILCNRPDGEAGSEHTDHQQLQQLAEQAGLTYVYQPVNGAAINHDDVAEFAEHLEQLPGPVLAHCRSGTRCTVLWVRSQAGQQPTETLLGIAAQAGYDMSGQRPYLDAAPKR